MSFFESTGGMNVRGVTFNDHGSGNMTINNNQKHVNIIPGSQNTIDNVQDNQEMCRAFIDWKRQESSAPLPPEQTREKGPFFKSGGEITVDGATINNYGSGNAAVNNNQTYDYRFPGAPNTVNNAPQDNGFPALNYQYTAWQQQGPYAHFQPQAGGGQITDVPQSPTPSSRSSLPRHRSPSSRPSQSTHSNRSYTTSSSSNESNAQYHKEGATETILEDAENWSEEPAQIVPGINSLSPEAALAQQRAISSPGDQTVPTLHSVPATSHPSVVANNVDDHDPPAYDTESLPADSPQGYQVPAPKKQEKPLLKRLGLKRPKVGVV